MRRFRSGLGEVFAYIGELIPTAGCPLIHSLKHIIPILHTMQFLSYDTI